MLLAALLAATTSTAAPAAAPLPAQPPAEPGSVIVVTGKPLDATRRALEECIARKCPAEEDIGATLAHAENLFVAGDYKQARAVLKKSIGRNGDEAARLPIPVAGLYRANGRVAAHLGEGEDYHRSAYRSWTILKEGADVPEWQRLAARLEVANMISSLQGLWAGRRAYLQLAEEADRAGRADIAAIARLKAIWAEYVATPTRPVEKQLWRIANEANPATRQSRLGALILLARIERDRKSKQGAAAEALIKELSATRSTKPTLLYAPEISQLRGDKWNPDPSAVRGYSVTQRMAAENFDDRWVDIAFRIEPNGRVADVEIVRESGSTRWAEPVLGAIAGRVYAPLADGQSQYRLERFTWTSNWDTRIDTRLRVRSPEGVIQSLDLTAGPPPAKGS